MRGHGGLIYATPSLARDYVMAGVRPRVMVARLAPIDAKAAASPLRPRVEDPRAQRLAHLTRMGVAGPHQGHVGRRPQPYAPNRPEVRWPVAAGPHPVEVGIIPPSQRAARQVWIPPMVRHHSGRR
jgi:hypothetical protein